jgi:hypothetical protein
VLVPPSRKVDVVGTMDAFRKLSANGARQSRARRKLSDRYTVGYNSNHVTGKELSVCDASYDVAAK